MKFKITYPNGNKSIYKTDGTYEADRNCLIEAIRKCSEEEAVTELDILFEYLKRLCAEGDTLLEVIK